MPVQYWLVASCAMILIAFSKAGFGGGPGVLAAPMMSTVVSSSQAVAIMLPIMIVCDIWCVIVYRKGCVWSLAGRLLAGFVVGVGIATLLLANIPGQDVWLKKVIGGLAILFGLCYFLVLKDQRRVEKYVPQTAWFGLLMGILAGISSTLAHAAGPPVTMYLMSQAKGQEKASFMGTMVVYTFFGNLLKVPSYLVSGNLNFQTLAITWPLLAVVPIGLAVGWYLNRKLSGASFQGWINGLLILIGAYLVLA